MKFRRIAKDCVATRKRRSLTSRFPFPSNGPFHSASEAAFEGKSKEIGFRQKSHLCVKRTRNEMSFSPDGLRTFSKMILLIFRSIGSINWENRPTRPGNTSEDLIFPAKVVAVFTFKSKRESLNSFDPSGSRETYAYVTAERIVRWPHKTGLSSHTHLSDCQHGSEGS